MKKVCFRSFQLSPNMLLFNQIKMFQLRDNIITRWEVDNNKDGREMGSFSATKLNKNSLNQRKNLEMNSFSVLDLNLGIARTSFEGFESCMKTFLGSIRCI